MRRAIAMARQVAGSDATILLTGESGTGKSVLARAIHAWSRRRGAPFLVLPCATLADQPREDDPRQLEAARGGTLFLDEVGDLPISLQGKLLRALAERCFEPVVAAADTMEVEARVIAATKRDLEADVQAERFREDLFFRLSVVTIWLPPLREREEDLEGLGDHLLAYLANRYGRGALRLAPEARQILAAYHWPGNARELVNVLEHAVVVSRGETITPEHLPERLVQPVAAAMGSSRSGSLEELERRHIQRVLSDSETLDEAAGRLGIDPTTLWRKRKRYGLEWARTTTSARSPARR